MKQRYSILHKLITNFARGAQGGGYGKWAILLFPFFSCLIAIAFAGFFHFLGAFWGCTIAAVFAALALAHFDAYESEHPEEAELPSFKECSASSPKKRTRPVSKRKVG